MTGGRVRVQLPGGHPGGQRRQGRTVAQVADLLAQLGDSTISSANLQALGVTLYQSLFIGEIGMLLNRALGETIGNDALGLRLRLRINPPELAALPWEFLYSPERRLFLAASVETPLSRYLNLPEPVRQRVLATAWVTRARRYLHRADTVLRKAGH